MYHHRAPICLTRTGNCYSLRRGLIAGVPCRKRNPLYTMKTRTKLRSSVHESNSSELGELHCSRQFGKGVFVQGILASRGKCPDCHDGGGKLLTELALCIEKWYASGNEGYSIPRIGAAGPSSKTRSAFKALESNENIFCTLDAARSYSPKAKIEEI
jgi:hypothetical protein